ncbi:Lsr2 family protein [Microbacterium sp. PRC9]|uniref:histone-like nucleoid-structuring protein Lsr2 n=1 Tax=Microbacterium sp. PRC9 TaxID=2962591 RepID=UPI0028818288|nr:Lsr2 family protein [Microbacterium sp. PRC9]MDT0142802.1 Lsr2 family protein [Microbacterium sp. PRC9]
MAKRIISQTLITDDLTGEELPETDAENITFTYGGVSYEIDLSKKNAKKLDDFIAPYVDAARKVGKAPAAKSKAGGPAYALEEVRQWAKENGYEVNDRGRIPNKVLEAWQTR